MPRRRFEIGRHAPWSNAAWAITFVLLAALGGWWTVLISRLVEEGHAHQIALHGDTPEVDAEYARKRRMLVGESAFMSVLALSLVWLAWRSVQVERAGMRRLEGVLAASTHELKTPVAGVRVLLESLQSGVLPADQAGPYLERGIDACDRLEHLIEGVLTYQAAMALPDAGVEVRPLGEWLGPVLAHRRADGIDQQVDLDLGAAGEVPVRAARDAVRVVFENLLDNARKYGAGPVRIEAGVAGAEVRVDVIDRGEGFPPDEAEALFEPYQRGREAGTRHGTGLGLYLARTLVRNLGGDLTAASVGIGQGATFTVRLRRGDG